MPNADFQLTLEPNGPLQDGPQPSRVSFPLERYEPAVATGDEVTKGSLIARAKIAGAGALHSPIAGTVTEIRGLSEFSLVIEAGENEVAGPEPRDLSQKSPADLRVELAELGIDIRPLKSARTLIVNAMPPEPGITVYGQLLRDYRSDVAHGLETAKRITTPAHVILAGADVDVSALGNCTVKHLKPVYPNGLDPMIGKAVTGSESLADVATVSILELYLIGRTMETGLPCTETLLTVGNTNMLAAIGTPVGDLLSQAGIQPKERDRIIIGGPLRGKAAFELGEGIMKDSLAVFPVPHGMYPPTADNPCLNCGECTLNCPARIMPNLISRAAEFSFFDRARGYGVDHCFECGICGYHCPGRRPLLQYIRLAKKELIELDAKRALKEKQLQMAEGDR